MPDGSSGIRVEKRGDVDVFALSSFSPMQMSVVDQIEQSVFNEIDDGRRKFVFDFSDLDYLSSPLLKTIIVAHKRLQQDGGRIVLVGLNEHVRAVFDVVGFERLFGTALETCPDIAGALEKLKKGAEA